VEVEFIRPFLLKSLEQHADWILPIPIESGDETIEDGKQFCRSRGLEIVILISTNEIGNERVIDLQSVVVKEQTDFDWEELSMVVCVRASTPVFGNIRYVALWEPLGLEERKLAVDRSEVDGLGSLVAVIGALDMHGNSASVELGSESEM